MSIQHRRAALAVALLGCLMFSTQAVAGSVNQTCAGPGCNELKAIHADELVHRLERRTLAPDDPALAVKAGGAAPKADITLLGSLAGTWTTVNGFVTFPYIFPGNQDLGPMQILVRGFIPQRDAGTDVYRVNDWDGLAYWIRFDTSAAGDIPRLVPAVELVASYTPGSDPVSKANEAFPELADEVAVQRSCSTGACSVQWVPYVEYREQGVDYSTYPEGAAVASLYFVVDAQGDAIAAVVDISSQDGSSVRTKFLFEGDEMKLYTNAYRISEPDFRYLVEYVPFTKLTGNFAIEREHYVPGSDFDDPDLPDTLNAGERPMRFLLDAYDAQSALMGGGAFTYGGPFELGYRWAQVPQFIHRGNFEPLSPIVEKSAKYPSVVKSRPAAD